METLKNFLIGVIVVVLSLILLPIVLVTWPFLIGISSIALSILGAILFVVLVFYIIVLIGYATRQLVSRNKNNDK